VSGLSLKIGSQIFERCTEICGDRDANLGDGGTGKG
jgi:hypothetical protein